jgi:hypothetical protein
MTPELKHIIDMKEMLAAQGATLTEVQKGLEHHIAKDHEKFGDLYKRTGDLEVFRGRARGMTKGVTAGIGLVTLISGAVAKAKGWF